MQSDQLRTGYAEISRKIRREWKIPFFRFFGVGCRKDIGIFSKEKTENESGGEGQGFPSDRQGRIGFGSLD